MGNPLTGKLERMDYKKKFRKGRKIFFQIPKPSHEENIANRENFITIKDARDKSLEYLKL